MSDKTVREYILEELAPHLPVEWKVEPGVPTLGTLSKPVLWLEYTEFVPLPQAPLDNLQVSADLCIVTSKSDLRKGENEADDLVADLYAAVWESRSFYNITARKTVFLDAYFGWRVSINVITKTPTKE